MRFHGGVHPPEHKELSRKGDIIIVPPPKTVMIPLQQHTGAPCEAAVEKDKTVAIGEKIGDSKAFVSSPVHASIAGKVKAIGPIPHPTLCEFTGITIEAEGEQNFAVKEERDWKALKPEEIIPIIREAGIVGMGGAAFPTHVKLTPPAGKKVEVLVINGAECEPYLTSDEQLMLTQAKLIIEGVKILSVAAKAERCVIGIENNKPQAIKAIEEAVKSTEMPVRTEVNTLQTMYPQGSEKQLIYALTGREVPSGGLPVDVGVVMQNVGTSFAVYEAVVKGKPLIERILTMTGSAINNPGNYLVRIGTPLLEVIQAAGGIKDTLRKVIMGGPMMGIAQSNLQAPIIKGTSGILFLSEADIKQTKEYPCIRCGTCVNACPQSLVPTYIAQLVKKKKYEEAKSDYNLMDCIECGCCTYACPSKIPIIQYVRLGKFALRSMKKK